MELVLRTVLSEPQKKVYCDTSRSILLVAGRRFGKTTLAAYVMRRWSLTKSDLYAYIAPTWRMAKNIFWDLFLSLMSGKLVRRSYRNSLEVELINGSWVRLYGAQNYDSIRGEGFAGVIVDETKDIPREAWFEVIRPALSDKLGKSLVIGTPRGFNDLLYDINNQSSFVKYKFSTIEGGRVSIDEIEQARRELDERTFKQEFEAEFVDNTGLVYYSFSKENIVDYQWNTAEDIYATWDFNVGEKPMSCILLQKRNDVAYAFQEFVHINSNTMYTARVVADWLKKQGFSGKIWVTGDFAGKQRTTSATRTDYEIILNTFKEAGFEAYLKIKPVKSIKGRVALLNSYFTNTLGEHRLFVTPNCTKLIKDLQQVVWNENGLTLDDRNPERTHPSDALSYYVYNFSTVKIFEEI